MQQVVSVARPNRKRRRTSKADAALEAGEDEIRFLADFPPLIPEGENNASDDAEPKKKWTSPIYSFFSNITIVHKDDGSRYHLFKHASIWCQNNGPKDHAIRCFGQNVVDAAIRGDTTKNPDGLIFAAFARAGQWPVDVMHRAHTNAEARGLRKHLVCRTLLKIAVSASFAKCKIMIDNSLQEHPGQLSFATDAWTSPNHRAFVVWTVHLPLDGNPLSFLLDIIEVPEITKISSLGTNSFNKINRVRCFAHTLNLIAKSILKPFLRQYELEDNEWKVIGNLTHVPAPRSSDNFFNSFQNLGAIEDEARDELSDYLAAPRVKTDDPMEW
ncbi:hypothetical protein B0H14DRAFT_3523058 [Mycena olivaceomarginata]|nr:hypothetical protein B0H14DRAFT_3523058 [Mycena olivaceomarginata]